MENLIEEVSVALSGKVSYVEMVEGDSRLNDFSIRGDGTFIDKNILE
jgi:hypothetical protein